MAHIPMEIIHHKSIMTFIAVFLVLSSAAAQTKSIGTTWSFSGIGLTYCHEADNRSFFDIQGKIELGELFMNRTDVPGVSLAFTRNYILKEWESEEGDKVYLISGPGVSAGWSRDYMKGHGVHLGLKGCFGIECRYSRNLKLSLYVSPVLGVHATNENNYMKLEYYRNGLLGTIIPEIGIKYSF